MRAVDDLYQRNGRGEYRILCTCLGHYLLWNEWWGRQPGFYDRMNYSVFVGCSIHTCSHQIRPNLYPYIYSFFFCEHKMGKGLRVFRNKNMFCEIICEKLTQPKISSRGPYLIQLSALGGSRPSHIWIITIDFPLTLLLFNLCLPFKSEDVTILTISKHAAMHFKYEQFV